jgi:hypothetical protein
MSARRPHPATPLTREILMRSMPVLAAVLTLASSSLAATAMPADSGLKSESAQVIRIADGCGPDGFRGPGGHCRPRGSCPPGWHPGPAGYHCFPNHYWRRYW